MNSYGLIKINKKVSVINLAQIFFLFFIISLFFPIRYVFPTLESFITGLYSDFTSFSLYLSDVFLIIAFFFTLCYNYNNFIKLIVNCKLLVVLLIWLILAIFLFNPHISALNIWSFFKFIELMIVAYGTTRIVFSNKSLVFSNLFIYTFTVLGTIQSIIGLLQFLKQAPIGLSILGEQQIYPYLSGIAKIVSDETTYIRAYGTFPHPNVLSVFLVVSIFFIIYLLLNQQKRNFPNKLISNRYSLITNFGLNLALFINILGFTLTFSRGAFLSLGLGLLIWFGFIVFSPSFLKHVLSLPNGRGLGGVILIQTLVIIIVSMGLSFFIFKPFLLTRATISDQASVERKIYNQTAINIIKDKPIIGIGAGESLLHMEQYAPIQLKPYQIQPIHNYFLLSASEIGIIGALMLIWIFLSHLSGLYKTIIPNSKFIIQDKAPEDYLFKLTLISIPITCISLMFFDHYFYTIQSTQMLLWVILGLIANQKSNEAT